MSSFLPEPEKGRGALRQGLVGAKSYLTQPGTTMGVGSFSDPRLSGGQDWMQTQLQLAALGQGPSAAQTMMQQGLGRAQAGLLSAAGNATGSNRAGALRGALYAGGDMSAQMMQDMAALRAQEQMQAREQFLNLMGQRQQGMLGMEQLGAQNLNTILGNRRGQAPGSGWGAQMGGQLLGGGLSGLGTGLGMGLAK